MLQSNNQIPFLKPLLIQERYPCKGEVLTFKFKFQVSHFVDLIFFSKYKQKR